MQGYRGYVRIAPGLSTCRREKLRARTEVHAGAEVSYGCACVRERSAREELSWLRTRKADHVSYGQRRSGWTGPLRRLIFF
jgi:hypothetical protein